MREQKLEAIRQKCIEANPDIQKSEINCICGHQWNHHNVTADFSPWKYRDYRKECDYCICKKYRQNPTPTIRLADVLLAIGKKDQDIFITSNGEFGEIFVETQEYTFKPIAGWNLLKDSLTEQSDETINFLFELLQTK